MDGTALLDLPEGMRLDQIQITEHGLLIEVRATSPTCAGYLWYPFIKKDLEECLPMYSATCG